MTLPSLSSMTAASSSPTSSAALIFLVLPPPSPFLLLLSHRLFLFRWKRQNGRTKRVVVARVWIHNWEENKSSPPPLRALSTWRRNRQRKKKSVDFFLFFFHAGDVFFLFLDHSRVDIEQNQSNQNGVCFESRGCCVRRRTWADAATTRRFRTRRCELAAIEGKRAFEGRQCFFCFVSSMHHSRSRCRRPRPLRQKKSRRLPRHPRLRLARSSVGLALPRATTPPDLRSEHCRVRVLDERPIGCCLSSIFRRLGVQGLFLLRGGRRRRQEGKARTSRRRTRTRRERRRSLVVVVVRARGPKRGRRQQDRPRAPRRRRDLPRLLARQPAPPITLQVPPLRTTLTRAIDVHLQTPQARRRGRPAPGRLFPEDNAGEERRRLLARARARRRRQRVPLGRAREP